MKMTFILLGALFLSTTTQAAEPDVAGVVTYEVRQVMSSGVTRVEVWQERLIRQGQRIWTQRVVPSQNHSVETEAEHAGHKHFDYETAGRLVTRHDNGELSVQFFDDDHKMRVEVPQAEYGPVGFDGNWEAAAHLVPLSVVRRMPIQKVDTRGGRWHVEKAKGWSHRILWSDAKSMAMRIESQRDDGSFRRVVTFRPTAAVSAAQLPWSHDVAYVSKQYDDFLD